MINGTLAFWVPGGFEWIVIFFISGFWLLLIILPVLYVVHSIKERRKILAELEKLTGEVRLLRQEVKEMQKDTG